MIKPTEYKSISYTELGQRTGTAIDQSLKNEATGILTKFVELFKLEHL
jgi:hypothetical protein